jgi:lipopolysaccharide/colanic/teichoic acid biosynthesis glycosyltransferase
MNNSELSITTSSEGGVVPQQTGTYPQYWDNSPNERFQSDVPFHDEYSGGGLIDVPHVKRTASTKVQDMEAIGAPPWSEIVQPDFGLWLLHRAASRHDRWRLLSELPRSLVSARHCGLQYSSSWIKRSCDIVGSLLLLIMLAPLFIVVAILIKLDSPGPVLFRHRRVGMNGEQFLLWKFRSMRTDVPEYEVSPRNAVDARLTRVGKIIRRLSVDEMPQLINVLRGEMSLVGPRPEMAFIVDRYQPADCERLFVRPGITGLWQISPARACPIHENLQYDLHYIRNQNIVLDLTIIVRTVTAVIRGIGAV